MLFSTHGCVMSEAFLSVFLFTLIAVSPVDDPTSYAAMGWIIAGIFGIVGLANQGMALWDRLFPRATPPAHEMYATKAEVAKLEAEHEEEMARIEKRFEEWMEQQAAQHRESMEELRKANVTFGDWQRSIERALGHVETKADIGLGKVRK